MRLAPAPARLAPAAVSESYARGTQHRASSTRSLSLERERDVLVLTYLLRADVYALCREYLSL